MLQQPLDAVRARPLVRERDGGYRVGVVLLAAFGLTAFASMQMHDLLSPFGVSALEWVLLALFALNFLWISAAASTAAIGAMVLLFARRRRAPAAELSTKSRTAIVFPIYNEDPAGVFGAAEAVLDELHAAGVCDRFECFFLSDTNNPERALAEEAVFNALREARPELTFHYRRRTINRVRKSGNIEDFVHRWGDRYDYMIVFDADSLMSADAICELVRRMDNQPATALIQTLPTLIRAQTLFARTQQFAMRAYGPIFGAGLSWWSGGAGNYWGHNAIIRVAAFAAHAGLPDLPGKAPLGGPILSHDFVEAALLRRAGWRVEIAWDIAGSYEQSPPTLADMMARDARWIQGNLQHIRVLGAHGFDGLSRLHIASGVMGYGSSLLWALLLIVGIVLAAGEDPGLSYFSDDSPYPMWPVSDAGNGLSLALLTAVVVLAPKWLSLLLWTAGRLPGWSRSWRFPVGMFIELLLSAVMAPVQMVSQTIGIVRTLRVTMADGPRRIARADDSTGQARSACSCRTWRSLLQSASVPSCSMRRNLSGRFPLRFPCWPRRRRHSWSPSVCRLRPCSSRRCSSRRSAQFPPSRSLRSRRAAVWLPATRRAFRTPCSPRSGRARAATSLTDTGRLAPMTFTRRLDWCWPGWNTRSGTIALSAH